MMAHFQRWQKKKRLELGSGAERVNPLTPRIYIVPNRKHQSR